VTRIGDPLLELALVGQEQQALAVVVQPVWSVKGKGTKTMSPKL